MSTGLCGEIDYYITMKNKEVISSEISDSTKSYVAAVRLCVGGRERVCENINSLPFRFLAQKMKRDANAHKAEEETKGKSDILDFFLKVKKIPMMENTSDTPVYACSFAWLDTLVSRKPRFLS